MGFQNKVNLVQAPAVEGDFASTNPRASVLAGPGGLVAGLFGVIVGRFGWLLSDGKTVSSFGQGNVKPAGFVARTQQALIEVYLQEYSMIIPEGFGVTLHDAGDFWVKVAGSTAATIGAQVYANYADGSASVSAPAGATATGSMGATFTATATGNQLAVTSVTGKLVVGDTLSGTGIPAGTTIIAGPSAGGAGTYTTSVVTTAAAATVTSFGVNLHVTAVTGTLNLGDPISGTGIPAGATIESQVGGAIGGIGDYTLNVPATAYVASTALTTTGGILTSFYFKSAAAVGELAKISTWGN